MTPDSSRDAGSSATSLERRKALLGALGKGSVLLSASVPLKAFTATGRVVAPNGGQCTVSGNGSILGSHTVNSASTDPCGINGPTLLISMNDSPVTRDDTAAQTGLAKNDLNALGFGGVLMGPTGKLAVKTNSDTGSGATFDVVSAVSAYWVDVLATATFAGSLGAGSSLPYDFLLYGLYAGTRPNASQAAKDAAAFAAAYIAAGESVAAPTGRYKVPFDRLYVKTAWKGPAPGVAAAFFASII